MNANDRFDPSASVWPEWKQSGNAKTAEPAPDPATPIVERRPSQQTKKPANAIDAAWASIALGRFEA